MRDEISKGGGGRGHVARGFKFFLDDSIRFEVSRDDGERASALNRVRCWEGGGRVDSLQVGEVRLVYILERNIDEKYKNFSVYFDEYFSQLYWRDNYSRISSISRYSFPVARKQIS